MGLSPGSTIRKRVYPPPYLRVLTAGSADITAFLKNGKVAADLFTRLAETHGQPLTRGAEVLDFGCGCGRVARFLADRVSLTGCDINPKLVHWCGANLQGEFSLSLPEPPLKFPDATFSVVYAVSVFTHLSDERVRRWLSELARILKPDGLAILTFFDEAIPAAADFHERLLSQGFVVRHQGPQGSNLMCGYYSTNGFAEAAKSAFKLVEAVPSHESGIGQAVAVFRKQPHPR